MAGGRAERRERGENVGFGKVTYQLAHLLHTCTGESIDTVFYLHLALDPTPIPTLRPTRELTSITFGLFRA